MSGMWWLSWGLAEGRTLCVIEGQPCEARGGGTGQGLRGVLRVTVGCSEARNAVLQGLLLGARVGGGNTVVEGGGGCCGGVTMWGHGRGGPCWAVAVAPWRGWP